MIWLMVGAYIGVVAIALVLFLRFRKQAQNTSAARVEEKIQRASSSQEFLPFESITDGVVKLDANRFRAFLSVEPVNFFFLTQHEQQLLEASFRSFLDGLRYPIQICVNSVPLDLTEHLESLESGQEHLPPHLQAYAAELAGGTRAWIAQNSPIRKRYTIVVTYDFEQDAKRPIRPEVIEEQAHKELALRCQQLSESLSRSGLGSRRMNDEEILALYYQVLNRHPGVNAASRHLFDADLTSVYSTRAEEGSHESVQAAC